MNICVALWPLSIYKDGQHESSPNVKHVVWPQVMGCIVGHWPLLNNGAFLQFTVVVTLRLVNLCHQFPFLDLFIQTINHWIHNMKTREDLTRSQTSAPRFSRETATTTRPRCGGLTRSWPSTSECFRRGGLLPGSAWGWRSWAVTCLVRTQASICRITQHFTFMHVHIMSIWNIVYLTVFVC